MQESTIIADLMSKLLIILTAGFLAGIVCKRLHLPMVIGYLVAGAIVGQNVLGLLTNTESVDKDHASLTELIDETPLASLDPGVSGEKTSENAVTDSNAPHPEKAETPAHSHQPLSEPDQETKEKSTIIQYRIIDQLAHLGAILLLFSIGINFSPSELLKIWRYFLIGGTIQMFSIPLVITVLFLLCGYDWKVGILIGSAAALSSTVLVFKSLEECGQANAPHGLRAVAILLFQDVAVVPLLLLVPLLGAVGADSVETVKTIVLLLLKSVVFVSFVLLTRYIFSRWILGVMTELKSVELMVLFTLTLVLSVSLVAVYLELSAALGALAAGVILSENRLTHQITAITVPFRETFSAIFFVSLGALFDYHILFSTPVQTVSSLLAVLALKTLAAAVAFRALKLNWTTSLAMGLGLSQLGELSFILMSQGVSFGLIDHETYQRMLFIALTSIILTPFFLRVALRWTHVHLVDEPKKDSASQHSEEHAWNRAVVIGVGPIGGRSVSFLELSGYDVCLLDMNPVNIHSFAQQGFRTVAGDATDTEVLSLAMMDHCRLVVVALPDDQTAIDVVQAIRMLNDDCRIVVRCHYLANVRPLSQSGANQIICEETEAGAGILRTLERLIM